MESRRPLALVTGASSGIGAELARLFAEDGYDVIVAADRIGVEQVANQLDSSGSTVQPVVADLRTSAGVAAVHNAVLADGRPLAAAALNAGIGSGGKVVDTDVSTLLDVVDVNVRGTVHLAKLVLDAMTRNGSGKVLITSSVASLLPGPYQAVYNASKAFLQTFADGLQAETKGTGVTVTSLMPGATDTDFFRRAGMEDTVMGRMTKDDPADVARQGYAAMQSGKRKVVAASAKSKALAAMGVVVPTPAKAALHKVLARPRTQ